MIGRTISHYRIVDKLGEGGMGVVYKAEDTRLHRTAALKFLPRQGGSDEDRERFFREARAAASLDHPNICTVYEIDEIDGQVFLAMQFLEGTTLDKRIAEAPLPLATALDIGRQTAEGLEAAHKRGVVHRDIKPANLMLTGDNPAKPQVKILDFGLAKLAEGSKLTQADSVLGTIAYMSPEQAQGQKVDPRTDIWSLGATLYEAISGEPPFKGHYEQATVYSILNEDPEPLSAVRSRIPLEVEWTIEKCLAKDPDERYQSAAELAVDLHTLAKKLDSQKLSIHRTQLVEPEAAAGRAPATRALPRDAAAAQRTASRWGPWQVLLLAAMALGAALGIVALALRDTPDARELQPLRRFSISLERTLPPETQVRRVSVAPDGSALAFTTNRPNGRLWIQRFDEPEPLAFEGTDGVANFAWSPDSRSLAYLVGSRLHRIPVDGGRSIALSDLPGQFFGGLAWHPEEEEIWVFSGPPPMLSKVSANGGRPEPALDLTAGGGPRGRMQLSNLQLIEGRGDEVLLLYAGRSRDRQQVFIRSLTDETRLVALVDGSEPYYAPSGHLIYRADRPSAEIWAAELSLSRLEFEEDPFPVVRGGVRPSASGDGVLVYADDALGGPRQLVWRNRAGERIGLIGREQPRMSGPTLSHDGKTVAVASDEGGSSDIWIHDVERQVKTRLMLDEFDDFEPIWSTDDESIVFMSLRGEETGLWRRAADGSGSAELVAPSRGAGWPFDWSPDGESILYRVRGPGGAGLGVLRRTAGGEFESHPFLEGGYLADEARFSPNSEYVAYSSNESGRMEVYVRRFPDGSGRQQISTEGGDAPRWSPTGDELFYVEGDTLVAVKVRTQGGFQIRESERLFSSPALAVQQRFAGYDVGPDGRRFVLVEPAGEPVPPAIHVTLNWLDRVRRARAVSCPREGSSGSLARR